MFPSRCTTPPWMNNAVTSVLVTSIHEKPNAAGLISRAGMNPRDWMIDPVRGPAMTSRMNTKVFTMTRVRLTTAGWRVGAALRRGIIDQMPGVGRQASDRVLDLAHHFFDLLPCQLG